MILAKPSLFVNFLISWNIFFNLNFCLDIFGKQCLELYLINWERADLQIQILFERKNKKWKLIKNSSFIFTKSYRDRYSYLRLKPVLNFIFDIILFSFISDFISSPNYLLFGFSIFQQNIMNLCFKLTNYTIINNIKNISFSTFYNSSKHVPTKHD